MKIISDRTENVLSKEAIFYFYTYESSRGHDLEGEI